MAFAVEMPHTRERLLLSLQYTVDGKLLDLLPLQFADDSGCRKQFAYLVL